MNITYLLGAGASANCLPVIDELPSRLDLFRDYIVGKQYEGKYHELKKIVMADIKWLLLEMKKHKTVDTLARKYYLVSSKHDSLLRLKRILLTYFVYEQVSTDSLRYKGRVVPIPKENPDKRYDTFIASVINTGIDNLSLPNNIKIITWNYDLQTELAYREYCDTSITETQKSIQAIPSYQSLTSSVTFEHNRFGLIRLNGVAGIGELSNQKTVFDIIRENPTEDSTLFILDYYSLLASKDQSKYHYSCFNFSWESYQEFQQNLYEGYEQVKNEACKVMEETDILVVVGYSFPYFNRNIDKRLFANCPKLTKVYVQDMNAEQLISLLKSSFPIFSALVDDKTPFELNTENRVKLLPVSYTDQFFIPNELN